MAQSFPRLSTAPLSESVHVAKCPCDSRRPKSAVTSSMLGVRTLLPLKMPVIPIASVQGLGGGGEGGGGGGVGGGAGGAGGAGGRGSGGTMGGAGGGGGGAGGSPISQPSMCGASPSPTCQLSSKHHLCAA